MGEILTDTGKYRLSQVGISGKDSITHIAPPSDRVPSLMYDLFEWLKITKEHPPIVSSIFHYEFEFIYPLSDGNGRTERLWQSVILCQWKEFFAFIPIENVIRSRQEAESTFFVEFMLETILMACLDIEKSNQKVIELIAKLKVENKLKHTGSLKGGEWKVIG